MTTEPTCIDTHAPSPVSNPNVPPTAENLLRHVVAAGHAASTRMWTQGVPRFEDGETNRRRMERMAVWFWSFFEMTGAHDLYLALGALRQVDPTKADEVAEQIVTGYEAGDSYGEWLWEWCERLGLDPQAIDAEERERLAKFEATADEVAPTHPTPATESRTA